MKTTLLFLRALVLGALCLTLASAAQAQDGPLRLELNEGVIEPMPIALPGFIVEAGANAELAEQIRQVIAADLTGTGLFREVSRDAFIQRLTQFDQSIEYPSWRAINAQALLTGAVSEQNGKVTVKFRLFDVFSGQELGEGLQLAAPREGRRRLAHKVADAVYSRITGESGYFDSRVVFVNETGPKNNRKKRLAIMDYDGANVQYLTGSESIVLAPRFSQNGQRVLYTSYETGFPRIYVLDVGSVQRRVLENQPGTMSFAPRFSPDGRSVVFSLTQGSNTDIFLMDIASGNARRLTSAPSIETAPSFSPNGQQIVFESDRSGSQQLYIMPASGGDARRISFGSGRYGTPVWSPRGDLIAFTKQSQGRFHIGVMRSDGSDERLLTASFLDEGPSWSPNGRVIMFTRQTQGEDGRSTLYTVDITGRNLRPVRTPEGGSDASWGPLLQ